jgi:DNA mismatch endonuclease (patch repair protein)
MFKRPSTRAEFWHTKLARNRERDREAITALRAEGWRRLVVWECALRGPARLPVNDVISRCEVFIKDSERDEGTISGDWHAGCL